VLFNGLRLVVVLDVLDQVSQSRAVFHGRNFLTLDRVSINSALSNKQLLASLAVERGKELRAAINIILSTFLAFE
jgi:hypothetical protein